MFRKSWILIALFVVAAIAMSACVVAQPAGDTSVPEAVQEEAAAEQETAATAGEDDGVEINVLVESGGFQLQEAIAKKFKEETGHTVTFVQVPFNGVFERLTAEAAASSSSIDVATIPTSWIGRFADFFEPLDSIYTDEVQADLFPSLIPLSQQKGHFVALPTWTNTEIIYYRTDLWEDPEEQAAFMEEYGYELAPPTTWQEFIDMAIFFTRDTDGDGEIDLYGTDVKGASAGIDVEWFVHALQAGSPAGGVDFDGTIVVNDEGHLKALQFYTDLHCKYQVNPPNVLEVDWGTAQQLFYQGQTAMMRFWAHAYRLTPEDAVVAGKVGVAPMIAGDAGVASVIGPFFNVVPKTSEKKEVALEFVKFAYENNVLGIEAPLGLAARQSSYAQYAGQEGFEHFGPLMTTLSSALTKARTPLETSQQINDEVIVPTVQEALSCEADLKELLAQAAEDIALIME